MTHQSANTFYQQAHSLLIATPPDHSAALPLLHQAAAAGHAEAAFQLAGCYFHGQGTEADFEAARHWLQQAASAQHPFAHYNLLQWQESDGAPAEPLLPGYIRLAEQDFLPAQIRLLQYYANHGQPQAIEWAKRATEHGHPYAQYYLAQFYQQAAEPDVQAAHALYRQAAAQGFAAAHWQLGNQYRHGQAVARDYAQAAFHFRHAAEQGLVSAQTALAELLLQGGHGLEAAPEQALHWFQTASELQDSDAQAALAEMYLFGKHIERNPAKARQLAEQAARRNHAKALRLLGDIYRYGLSVAADADMAAVYYRRAADQGDMAAHQKLLAAGALGRSADYGRLKQAALQRQAAEHIYQRAFACHYGLGQVQDYAEAARLYLEAAGHGHGKAQTNLGMMYYNGQGMAADSAQAAHWFEAAAKQGDTVAQYNLACLHYHGEGVPRDAAAACRWLQNAIDGGHEQPDALQQLLQQWQAV